MGFILCLIVIFIFESEWPLWAPFVIIGIGIFMCICSKILAVFIEPRVASPKQKRIFHRMTMAELDWSNKHSVYSDNYSLQNEPYKVSDAAFSKPSSNKRWSFTKKIQNEKR